MLVQRDTSVLCLLGFLPQTANRGLLELEGHQGLCKHPLHLANDLCSSAKAYSPGAGIVKWYPVRNTKAIWVKKNSFEY